MPSMLLKNIASKISIATFMVFSFLPANRCMSMDFENRESILFSGYLVLCSCSSKNFVEISLMTESHSCISFCNIWSAGSRTVMKRNSLIFKAVKSYLIKQSSSTMVLSTIWLLYLQKLKREMQGKLGGHLEMVDLVGDIHVLLGPQYWDLGVRSGLAVRQNPSGGSEGE